MSEDLELRETTESGRTPAPVRDHSINQPSSGAKPAPTKRLPFFAIPLVLTLIFGGIVWFVSHRATKPEHGGRWGHDRVVSVTVAKAVRQSVPISIRTTGNVQAYSTVNVVPQVGGQLQQVFFTQGQFVHKGDLLFQIDPRQYQALADQSEGNVQKDLAQIRAAQANVAKDNAQIGQLQANLEKDQAQLRYAGVERSRYYKLATEGAVSIEQADQMATNLSSAQATIDADKKQIENARAVLDADKAQVETVRGTLEVDQAAARNAQIQLGWCQIRSPIDGKTGSLNVYAGNVVAPNNQTPLVTIAQVHPIYISFTIPEDNLDQVRRCINDGTLKVQAMIEGQKDNTVIGAASFLEYTVNTTSGTALLRATFPNTDNRLYPGQFVDVVVTMPADGDSIVIPAQAVQTTQQGNSVYVVQPDNSVKLVPVDLKRTWDDFAAIGKGLSVGDTIVTDGQLQLMPGAHVRIVTNGATGSDSDNSSARPHTRHRQQQ